MSGSEWYGEPHTLIVHSVTPPSGQFDDGEMDYEIQHPPSCKEKERGEGEHSYTEFTCDVAHMEREIGLPSCLRYSGTPITKPGTYRIQGWGTKSYNHEYGYEYDAGVIVVACEMCGGEGVVSDEGYSIGHPMTVTCPACKGSGYQDGASA